MASTRSGPDWYPSTWVRPVSRSSRPAAGTRVGVEWEFEWTPPANEVGDITFYAAGNAADNTNTTTSTVTPVEQLASTGGDSAILMLPSLLLISGALCAKLLRWKLN